MTVVRLVQVDSSESESPSNRIARVFAQLPALCSDVSLVMLPELWHIGAFDLRKVATDAVALDGPELTQLADIARKTGTWIHGGSWAIKHGNRAYNTSVVFDPHGTMVATYRKRHLFGFADGERTVIDEGNEFVVVPTPFGRVGLATCYDLRFPEMFRSLLEFGAQSYWMCSGWPDARIGHWTVLTQARAIENQAYMLACNGRGSHAGVTLGGRSIVVNPKGVVVAEATATDEFIDAAVDFDLVDSWREAFPVLKDRRV